MTIFCPIANALTKHLIAYYFWYSDSQRFAYMVTASKLEFVYTYDKAGTCLSQSIKIYVTTNI